MFYSSCVCRIRRPASSWLTLAELLTCSCCHPTWPLNRSDIPTVRFMARIEFAWHEWWWSSAKYCLLRIVACFFEKKWLNNWIKTNFKGGKKNKDLWMQYHKIAAPFQIKFHWVKGHSTNKFNNRCDELATAAADNGPWKIDTVFESNESNT